MRGVENDIRSRLGGEYKNIRQIYDLEEQARWLRKKCRDLNTDISPMESKIGKLLNRSGIFNFEQNFPLLNRWIGDFVFLREKIVLEYDGSHHLKEEIKLKDQEKDRFLCLMGWKVFRWNKETKFISAINQIKPLLAKQSAQDAPKTQNHKKWTSRKKPVKEPKPFLLNPKRKIPKLILMSRVDAYLLKPEKKPDFQARERKKYKNVGRKSWRRD